MRVCIHRGATEIGGTCVEIEAQGKRLVLDIGSPLDCPDPEWAELPDVPGFRAEDSSLLGVVLSHPHLDHYGLSHRLPRGTPILLGAAAQRILNAAAAFVPSKWREPDHVTQLEDRRPLPLGPFTVTPYLVDHSAYDAYAILVEADGQRLFYTGDLRGHGRKPGLFRRLIQAPPPKVDVLLMEGTTIQRPDTDRGFPSETDIELRLAALFKATPGMPLVWCSGQNIDRIVSVFRAAKRSGRRLIMDMYTAHILHATGNDRLPQAHWPQVRVFLPARQKSRIVRRKAFALAKQYRPHRIFPEDLASVAANSVLLFRDSMRQDVEDANCLDHACVIYSMWNGYLKEARMQPFLDWLKQTGIPLHTCHTSGHASVRDLHALRSAFSRAIAVPVHCAEPVLFAKTFDRARVHLDNEWWNVV